MNQEPSSRDGNWSALLTRRRLLEWSGLAGLFLLSGCTEDIGEEFPPNTKWPTAEIGPELPVAEKTDIFDERIEEIANMAITDEDEFAEAFDEYALEVEAIEREQDVLTIEYINTELYEEGNLHDIAPIAGGYAALINSGYDSQILGITVLDAAPASFGSAYIQTSWAEQYNGGELSASEYGELVSTTIESKRHPPEVGVSPDE